MKPDSRTPELASRVTLVALVAASAVSTDLNLSGIPQLAHDFGSGTAAGQATISLFMLGFSFGQLVFGPLSDHYGRKPVVAAGMCLYVVASLACTLAPSIGSLLAARALQGFAASSGPVIARAIVRDRYEGAEAARVMALLVTAMAVVPLVAPVIGSWLLYVADWRAQFGVLGLFGLAILAGLGRITESCPSIGQGRIRLGQVLQNFRACLANRRFTAFLLCGAACFSAMFTWISSSSWIVIELLGVRAQHFGYSFAAVGCGYMGGSFLSSQLVVRLGAERVLGIGIAVALGGAIALALCALFYWHSLAAVLACLLCIFCGAGMCLANAQMGAIAEFPQAAGGASAVFGFVQTTAAALTGFAVGQLYDASLRPTALLMLGAILVAGCGVLLLRGLRAGDVA